jgi:hypothetical protein
MWPAIERKTVFFDEFFIYRLLIGSNLFVLVAIAHLRKIQKHLYPVEPLC